MLLPSGTTRRSTDIAQQDRTHRTHNTKPVTHTTSNKSQNTCKHIECLHDTNLEHKLVDRSGLGGREWGGGGNRERGGEGGRA